MNDPLVIADLSEGNANVFYELALRHILHRPLVQIIRKGERIPFDVAGMRTVPIDHQNLDGVEEARKEIVRQIIAVEANPSKIQTPISVALEHQFVRTIFGGT